MTRVIRGEATTCRGLGAALVVMLQCARDYPGLPDVRTMKVYEFQAFYDELIPELKKV